ncbi:hypothetical protein RB195_000444 [Necator americanus]|uniref:Peptidase S72 domain-containing protein n=1 Tax=Necator americanus TaxID=51031 RepID=A0ABR1D9S4_NECAM
MLIVTAWSVFDPSRNASRVLRVEIQDVDDNIPQFTKGAPLVFVVPRSTSRSNIILGKVYADDRDGTDLNAIHYYLLPKCSTTAEFEKFSVNDYSGEITVEGGIMWDRPARLMLCVLASYYPELDVSELEFDAKNSSMIRVAVVFETETQTLPPAPPIENNTVTIIQENLRDTPIPVTVGSSNPAFHFSLDHVDFEPAQDSTGVLHSSTNTLVFVEPNTGDLRVNPVISEQPEGVYSAFVNMMSATTKEVLQQFVKKFHYVKDDMKMRYIFNMIPEEFAKNSDEFAKKLQKALDGDHPEGDMKVYLSHPNKDKRNSTWTSVCFHATMNGKVQGERAVMAALSQSTVENSELSKLYQLYKVINIERCEPVVAQLRQSAFMLPTEVVMLIAGVAILVLILIALLTYICFVRRYKDHLRAKQKPKNGAEVVPCVLDPSPTFILPPITPSLGYY